MIDKERIQQLEELKELTIAGKSDSDIAEKLGLPYAYIASLRRFLGLIRPRGINILEQYKSVSGKQVNFSLYTISKGLGLNIEDKIRFKAIDIDKKAKTLTLKFEAV